MRRSLFVAALIAAFVIGTVGSVFAYSNYLTTFNGKYGTSMDCGVCHDSTGGGGSRNPYGSAFEGVSTHSSNPSGAMDSIASQASVCSGNTYLDMINQGLYPGGHGTTITCPAPAPVACTDYTYSGWSACDASGQQTRTVTGNTPSGCTGTPSAQPVLTQACTPPPPAPAACTGYTYSSWSVCSASGQQTRTVTDYAPAGCTGTPPSQPVLTQACTPPPVPPTPTACTGYSYSSWSACQSNNQQTRTVSGYTPSGCTGTPSTSPLLTQACNYVPPTPVPPAPAATMPLPSAYEVFTHAAAALPIVSADPAAAQPIGFGPAASGGNTLDVKVNVGPFDGPVDVSLVVFAPSIYSDDLYFMNPKEELDILSDEVNAELRASVTSARQASEHEDYSTTDTIPVMKFNNLVLWKHDVMQLNEDVYYGPVSELPAGLYVLVLDVKSPGHEDNLYRWVSYIFLP
jgi:hypothetical protein